MTTPTLLIGFASLASCVLCMEFGGVSIRDTLFMPAYAKKDVVYKEQSDVIREVETMIATSPSFEVAKKWIRETEWPEKVLRISLARAQSGATSAQHTSSEATPETGYIKVPWSIERTVTRDGTGYGSIVTEDGQREIVIVDKSRQTMGADVVAYIIYVDHSPSN